MGRLVNELLELTRLQGAEPLPDPGAGRAGLGDRRGDRPHPDHGVGEAHRGRLHRPARRHRVRQRQPGRHRGDQPGGERDRLLRRGHHRRRWPCARTTTGSRSTSPTRASASPRTTSTGSSSASTVPTRPAPASTGGTGLGLAIVKHGQAGTQSKVGTPPLVIEIEN